MADVTERMLALLATLQSGRPFGGRELASRLDMSLRTLRRDVERLRGYGYPVETRPGPGGHYRLAAGRTMPPLVLDDDEAVAVLLGLATLSSTGGDVVGKLDADRDGDGDGALDGDRGGALDGAATRAYGKLDQFLPTRLRPRLVALRASLESGRQPTPDVSTALLATLAGAIGDRRIVRFTYAGKNGEPAERRVEPHRQIHLRLRWYLLGWDLDRSDWRVFRADRVTDLQVTSAGHEERDLPADSAIEYLRQGMHVDQRRVVLVVDAPPSRVADAFSFHDARLEAVAGRRTRVTVWLDTWEWLLTSLAFLDVGFEIVEPADFRAACVAFGRRLLASDNNNDGDGDGDGRDEG